MSYPAPIIKTDKGDRILHRDLHEYECYLCEFRDGVFILADCGEVDSYGRTVSYPTGLNLITGEFFTMADFTVLGLSQPPSIAVMSFIEPPIEPALKIYRTVKNPAVNYAFPWEVKQVIAFADMSIFYAFKTHADAIRFADLLRRNLKKHAGK